MPHSDDRLEDALAVYELARREGAHPDVRDWAAARPSIAPGLLFELVLLEFRLRWELDGDSPPVEQFLGAFPEFNDNSEMVLALVAAELDCSPGDPNVSAYAARFSRIAADIHALLRARSSSLGSLAIPRAVAGNDSQASTRTTITGLFQPTVGWVTPLPDGASIQVQEVFTVECLFDEGGLKWVHRATQTASGRSVALKTSKFADAGQMLEEGRLLARLEHPNIPPVVTLAGDPVPILVEVLIAGECWADRLAREERESAAVEVGARAALRRERLRANLEILFTICLPLQYALDTWRLIHSDIKPKNVMLGRHGEVYMLDWGLALQVGPVVNDQLPAPHKSTISGFRGTPAYVAPEMARCDRDRLGSETDVFLLGAVLHELLTGTPPYQAATPEGRVRALLNARLGTPPGVSTTPERPVPTELIAVAAKAMAMEPKDRYADAAAFAAAVKLYLRRSAAEDLLSAARSELSTVRSQVEVWRRAGTLHAAVTPLIAVADRFYQSGIAWNGSDPNADSYPEADVGERDARELLLDVAEEAGDFALAEAQIDRLEKLPIANADRLTTRRTQLRTRAARRARTRKVARFAMGGIVVAVAALTLLAIRLDGALDGERTERSRAEASAKAALAAKTEADGQRLRAEAGDFGRSVARTPVVWSARSPCGTRAKSPSFAPC